MADSRDFAVGANAFIRGFSFIDDINSRRRQEKKLDERLAQEDADRDIQRKIQQQQLAERGADRATAILSEQERKRKEQRQIEANTLLSDPNTDPEVLREYADVPGVAAILRQEGITARDDAQRRADLEQLIPQGGQQLGDEVTEPEAEVPSNQGLSSQGLGSQIQAAQLPGAIDAPPVAFTSRDLETIAETEGLAAAVAARDQANAAIAAANPADRRTFRGMERAQKEKDQKREAMDEVNKQWASFVDIADTTGDALRNTNANIQTAKYFADRNSIADPETQRKIDKVIQPAITETINTQNEILANVEPQSIEATNARRKLSQAYGLSNAINGSFSPTAAAGVDDRGLPIGGNRVLTDSVIEQGRSGPIASLPSNPDQRRADVTVLTRGVTGNRINDRFALAAFRRYKNGDINFEQYESLMTTGALPVAAPIFTQEDPRKDTIRTDPDGTRHVVQFARSPDKNNSGRNKFTDEGLAHVERQSKAYDTEDDLNRGLSVANSFYSWTNDHESELTSRGYDFTNTGDVASLLNIFGNQYIIRNQLDDEVFFQGDFLPSFEDRYGPLGDAVFNPRFQQDFGDSPEGKANRESITDFFGEDPITFQRLKEAQPIGNLARYQEIRRLHPTETAEMSNEDIEAELQLQARQAQGR